MVKKIKITQAMEVDTKQEEEEDQNNYDNINNQQNQQINYDSEEEIQSQKQQASQDDQSDFPSIKFLITSDNHLGYKETHPIRGQDSFKAFQEVLSQARKQKVDFVLLGGDLFHEQTPSLNTQKQAIDIIQNKIMGDGDIQLEIYNNFNFKCNYEDENHNIDMPIFIINGNHDAPAGTIGDCGALDLFHSMKYVNYFGQSNISEQKKLIVKPLKIEKSFYNNEGTQKIKTTKIALYGIGYMKETRLNELFTNKLVEFEAPGENDETNDYYNILVVHQNRFKGNKLGASLKQTIQEKMFPQWIDLVVWGHEHECKADLEKFEDCNYNIYQPGSTVITSMIEGEMKPKGFGVFNLQGQKFEFHQNFLRKNFRPLIYEQIDLQKEVELKKEEYEDQGIKKVFDFDEVGTAILTQKIQDILDQYKEEYKELSKILPMVKIRYSSINSVRQTQIEQKFQDFVANPGEITKFNKQKVFVNHQQDIDNNINLNENFIETLQNKESFNSLGQDVHKELLIEFADNVQQFQPTLFSGDMMVDLFENLNFRSRNGQIDEGITTIINEVQNKITKKQKEQSKKTDNQQEKKMSYLLEKIEENLGLAQNQTQYTQQEINDIDQYEFKKQVDDQLQDFKLTLKNNIKESVNEVYKSKNIQGIIDNKREKALEDNEQNNQKGKKKGKKGKNSNTSSEDDYDSENSSENETKTKKKPKTKKKALNKIQEEGATSEDQFSDEENNQKNKKKQVKKPQTGKNKKKGNSADSGTDVITEDSENESSNLKPKVAALKPLKKQQQTQQTQIQNNKFKIKNQLQFIDEEGQNDEEEDSQSNNTQKTNLTNMNLYTKPLPLKRQQQQKPKLNQNQQISSQSSIGSQQLRQVTLGNMFQKLQQNNKQPPKNNKN